LQSIRGTRGNHFDFIGGRSDIKAKTAHTNDKVRENAMTYDVIIIGGGPSGLTAAIYGARAGLSVLVLEKFFVGGQMTQIYDLFNYPGFPDGINGIDLAALFEKQAKKWGAEIKQEEVTSLNKQNGFWQISTKNNAYSARTIIAATGAYPKNLGVKGEAQLRGKGVSYCGTCDGPLYRNGTVAVIGGGNSAIQDADFLTRYVKKVHLIHRRDEFRAQKVLVDELKKSDKVQYHLNCSVTEILGTESVIGINITNHETGINETIPVDGVFIFIGYNPNSDFCKDIVKTNPQGRIITDSHYMTSELGFFAIGDVRDKELYQVATAVGDGANVIHSVQKYLKENA
jgi:thioredoxin reductase (NADPH)